MTLIVVFCQIPCDLNRIKWIKQDDSTAPHPTFISYAYDLGVFFSMDMLVGGTQVFTFHNILFSCFSRIFNNIWPLLRINIILFWHGALDTHSENDMLAFIIMTMIDETRCVFFRPWNIIPCLCRTCHIYLLFGCALNLMWPHIFICCMKQKLYLNVYYTWW